jgi:hypothetical protein
MADGVDRRDPSAVRATPQRLAELQGLAAALSAARPVAGQLVVARVDPLTGNAAAVQVAGAAGSAAGAGGDVTARAQEAAAQVAPLFGFAGGAPAEFVASPPVPTSSGAQVVQLQPRLGGLDVFGAGLTARFAQDGVLQDVVGTGVASPVTGAAAPQVGAEAAVEAAARQLAAFVEAASGEVDPFGQRTVLPPVDLAGLDLRVTATDPTLPDRPTELADGTALRTPVRARLVWFPLGDGLRLGWEVSLVAAADDRPFRCVVDAQDGSVLYFQPS